MRGELIFQGKGFSVIQMPVNGTELIEAAKRNGNSLLLRRLKIAGWAVTDEEISEAKRLLESINRAGGVNNNTRFAKKL